MQINQAPVKPDAVFTGVVEPGNGSRYEYMIWRTGRQWYAAFPDFRVSSKIGGSRHTPDYVQEKMRCSTPDAMYMTDIINRCIGVDEVAHWELQPSEPSIGDFLDQVRNG